MKLNLPAPVTEYLAADRANDADALAACFVADGHVHDEKHDYRGTAAIAQWMREAKAKYQHQIEVLDATVAGNVVDLRVRLTGNFPGSPATARFTFTLDGDRITELAIH